MAIPIVVTRTPKTAHIVHLFSYIYTLLYEKHRQDVSPRLPGPKIQENEFNFSLTAFVLLHILLI